MLNDAGADLALVKVKGIINTQLFPPICLPSKGKSGSDRDQHSMDPKTNIIYSRPDLCCAECEWSGRWLGTK